MPAMLLYLVNHSKHIKQISLRYFETRHGQNEGDSTHSAISIATQKAEDFVLLSQLVPIFRLAQSRTL